MKVEIDGHQYTAVAHNNMGYDVTMLMRDWGTDEWKWWAFHLKRIGLQNKVATALAQWDDDNSSGYVGAIS